MYVLKYKQQTKEENISTVPQGLEKELRKNLTRGVTIVRPICLEDLGLVLTWHS